MAHGIIVQRSVAAMNTDAWNRPAVAAADVDNGSVFNLLTLSATEGESEVWTATAPATGALSNLWMAYEPEVVTTSDGTHYYKGINSDPRDFYNATGKVFTAFKLQLDDLVLMTADALAGTKSTNTFAVATNDSFKLTWAAAAVSGVSLKYLGDKYISIGTGAIGSQRVTAYLFKVVALA